MKRKKMCQGYITALRAATKHTKAVFKKIDAENQAIDQIDLFKEAKNEQ